MNTRIKTMGAFKSKHFKKEENGTTKDTVAKNDFNHGDANDLTGNLNKTGNTSQGLISALPISHQMQPDDGNEAKLTRIHQLPAVDACQNREKSDALRSDMLQQLQGVTGNLSQQQSGPSAKVLHQAQYILEQSTATKPGAVKVLVKMPGDDDESFQLTAENCTATEEITTKIHNNSHHTTQQNKIDNDTNRNTSYRIQAVNIKAALVKGGPSADPNNAANNTTAASADSSVKSKVQHKLNLTINLQTAVNKEGKLKGMEQNHPNKNAGNITKKEDKNGKNGQDEKQEPDIPPADPPEHTKGRWHPFTVNQSCSSKVRCKHNPGKGLPPNIRKWSDKYQYPKI